MTKAKFLSALERELRGLPEEDIRTSLDYYAEMIDERMDAGCSEEKAVAELGSPEEIVREMLEEPPKQEKRERKPWQMALLLLGSPLWVSLAIVAIAIVLAVFAAIWAVVAAAWVTAIGLGVYAIISLGMVVPGYVTADFRLALLFFGFALSSSGLAIFAAIGAGKLSEVLGGCSRRLYRYLKSRVAGREY